MSPSKRKQTPIRFTQQIRERLDAEVARTGWSINTIVSLALDRYLPPLGEAPKPAEPTTPASPPDGTPLDWD